MGKLTGKIALVTGGSEGIGFATAQEFIKEGAFVFITGRRKPTLDAAVAKLGTSALGIQADSAKLDDLDRLYAEIKQKKGKLDVLFVNAGGGEFAPLGQITEEHYDQTFAKNVKGLVFTVQKALPLLGKGGSIILNASIVATKGMPAFSVYSATKAAVRNFARGWTADLKGTGIRVNVVSPGPIDTPGLRGVTDGTDEGYKQFTDAMTASVPLGRVGQPEEIAKAVVYLASEDSSFVAGFDLVVDGGFAQI
ncbi:SDR family oxidoreductase [Granulicella sp. S156]|uniref:SDR family oxidoreductase n=1 Tax=Granulicella sp. S156 TaxID=1747224 RepID=UPI00131DA252|nr:SDR family oxidoreductase [Granulicella sp. S156]